MGIRSVYIFVFPLTFYTFALILNLMTTLHDRGYSWAATIMTFQLMPYLYSCYIIYTFVVVMTPMTGRSGSASNPDTLIAFMAALGTLLAFGFLVSNASKKYKIFYIYFIIYLPVGTIDPFIPSTIGSAFPFGFNHRNQHIPSHKHPNWVSLSHEN